MSMYKTMNAPSPSDGRLFSPVYERNGPPIIAAMVPILSDVRGPVLEIGSGTGQHAAALQLAFPHLSWHPSDLDAEHRRSVSAWFSHLRLPERSVLDLDAASDWAASQPIADLGTLDAIVSMNVIHIAPIEVAQGIFRGASHALTKAGALVFYGPFRENRSFNSPGDAAFDASLRSQDSRWGIRDLEGIIECAQTAGLTLDCVTAMPANNRLVVFRQN